MQILKKKTKTSTIALVLMLTFAATLVALPIVSAHDPPWDVPVVVYAVVRPDPIGVGQEALIIFWPNIYPPTAVGAYGDRYTWTVDVTTPSGSKTTLGPFTSDPVGGGWALYTPSEVGTYTIVANMEDHLVTGLPTPPANARGTEYINDTMLGSSSDPITLTVQEESIEAWPEAPLPEEYWTRPINGMNRDWWKLAGNWLGGAAQNVGPTNTFGYGLGPESAHIMWATPMWAGGIMDARYGAIGYQNYHYEGLNFYPPIVINGKLYYNVESLPREGWRVLDLYTGEELWFHNTTGPVTSVGGGFDFSGRLEGDILSFGQIYNYESPNQHGGMPYLWSSGAGGYGSAAVDEWRMFDAETGSYICSIGNMSTVRGTAVYGKEGSILRYNIANGRLTVWNSSRAIWYEEEFYSNSYWMWRPTLNYTFDGNNGYSLNVSIPTLPGPILAVREGEFVIGGTGGQNDADAVIDGTLWALSLELGKEGTLLWEISFTPPRAYATAAQAPRARYPVSGPTVVPEYNVFLFEEASTLQRWAYDLTTGNLLWGPTDPEPALNYYGMTDNVYEGKLLTCGYGGVLIAYNITTGEELWRYEASNVGFESPYGNYPIGIGCIADGKIYLGAGEHSPTQPNWRGPNLRCIDANTGKELWKISMLGVSMPSGNGGSNYAISDGYLLALNGYDNQIYCYGKGPSATTVSIKNDVIAKGNTVLIQGTVTDECAGAKQLVEEGKFNVVPAIADEYQEDWMEYLYMQQPCPMDLNGVPVKLEVFGEDGSYIEIGTVTSDPYGKFKCEWTPSDEGLYTVMATFGGSKSYYRSYDATGLSVGQAAAPAGPIEPEPTEPSEVPVITTELAIILAAVIVAVAVIAGFWIIRKRK
jgi:hypothetical protein